MPRSGERAPDGLTTAAQDADRLRVRDVTDDAAVPEQSTRVPAQARAAALTETLQALEATDARAQAEARAEADWFAGAVAPQARQDHDPARATDARPVLPRWRHRYTKLLVLCDLLVVAVAMDLGSVAATPRPPVWLVAVAALAVLLAAWSNRGYEHRFLGHGTEEFQRVWTACVYLVAAVSLAAYLFRWEAVRGLLLVGMPLAMLGLMVVRVLARTLLHRMRRRNRCVQKCIAIGSERSVSELVTATTRDVKAGLRIVGACVAKSQGPTIDGVPVLGAPSDVTQAVQVVGADTVILTAWSDVSQEDLRRLSWQLDGTQTQFLVQPRLSEVSAPRMHVRVVDRRPLLNVENPELGFWRQKIKRLMDLALTLPGLVLLSPVPRHAALRGPAVRQLRFLLSVAGFPLDLDGNEPTILLDRLRGTGAGEQRESERQARRHVPPLRAPARRPAAGE